MDRLSHVPLDRLLTTMAEVHDRGDPHPYDDCENSNETENEPDPTRADERVPIMLVPCGGASAYALREVMILERGRRRDPRDEVRRIAVARSALVREQHRPAGKERRSVVTLESQNWGN